MNTEHELFGELHEQEENGLFGNEHRRQYETHTDANNVLAEVRLSMEEILRDAVRRKATYSVQYADYDLNTWTAPVDLTQNRMDKLLDDGSIRKVRLELEM